MSTHATCFYCGNARMTVHKLIPSTDVEGIIDKQRAAEINDIVLRFTANLLQTVRQVQESQHQDTWLCCCMNCHHWMSRRSDLPVPPLPMQNLLWFLSCVDWYDEQKCDKRILLRLSKLIASENENIYQACFLTTEIQGLRHILLCCAGKSANLKVEIAKFYQQQNGNSLFLPNRHLANLLRPDYVLDSTDPPP